MGAALAVADMVAPPCLSSHNGLELGIPIEGITRAHGRTFSVDTYGLRAAGSKSTPPTGLGRQYNIAKGACKVVTSAIQHKSRLSRRPIARGKLPARDRKLIDRFIDEEVSAESTKRHYRATLEQWFAFARQRKIPFHRVNSKVINSWKSELRSRGKSEMEVDYYEKRVHRFVKWHQYVTAVRSRANHAPRVSPAANHCSNKDIIEQFIDTYENENTRNTKAIPLRQWLQFLAERGLRPDGLSPAVRGSMLSKWEQVLNGSNHASGTINNYLRDVRLFYAWFDQQEVASTNGHSGEETPLSAHADDSDLLEQFFATAHSDSSLKGKRSALRSLLIFLSAQGRTLVRPGNGSIEDWKYELKRSGRSSSTIKEYSRNVKAFYRWYNDSRASTNGSSGHSVAPSATSLPDVRDSAVQQVFLDAAPSPTAARHYRSALVSFSRFLDERRFDVLTTKNKRRAIEAWQKDIEANGTSHHTAHYYATVVNRFYDQMAEAPVGSAGQAKRVARDHGSTDPSRAQSASTNGQCAQLIPTDAPNDLLTKVDALVAIVNTMANRLDVIDSKLATSVASAQELVLLQGNLEQQWQVADSRLASAIEKLSGVADLGLVDQRSQIAWAREIDDLTEQVRLVLYRSADTATREIIASQPRPGGSCVEEIELLINGCFKGLETSNADIIDGAVKLDKSCYWRILANRLHRALLALDSYAQSTFDGDFKAFCEAAPRGHNTLQPALVIRPGPEKSASDGSLLVERTFPISVNVAESGSMFMPEYVQFGIEGAGALLHYYNDKHGRTRKVHIGYISSYRSSRSQI